MPTELKTPYPLPLPAAIILLYFIENTVYTQVMDTFIPFLCQYADYAHLIIFILLLITGLNIPISEDLIIITAAICMGVFWGVALFMDCLLDRPKTGP